jgi:YesN/AraC family two-component response regulator
MITQEIIEQFCDQCYTIRALYKEYSYLYEDNKERLDLLNKTARDFFHNLQVILIERLFLDICKITDPATSGKNSNLTIKYILKEIEQNAKENLGLDELSDEIHRFRDRIVEARHKI